MAYAYLTVHAERALWPIQNGGKLSALHAWAFLLLVITGPGAWSVDGLIGRARHGRDVTAGHAGQNDAERKDAQSQRVGVR
jgi:putative oxidoreductase